MCKCMTHAHQRLTRVQARNEVKWQRKRQRRRDRMNEKNYLFIFFHSLVFWHVLLLFVCCCSGLSLFSFWIEWEATRIEEKLRRRRRRKKTFDFAMQNTSQQPTIHIKIAFFSTSSSSASTLFSVAFNFFDKCAIDLLLEQRERVCASECVCMCVI